MQPTPTSTNRITSIDILRGVIMVLMALDHVRDFFTNIRFDPLDLTQTTPLLFFTRWITHYCAPTFVFLSGISAYLSLSKRSKKNGAWFLLTRGLWLIVLELTLINWSWSFHITFLNFFVQVIWAIGWSMIVLSALIFLRPVYIALFGLLLIAAHNAFDTVTPQSLGSAGTLWQVLHAGGFIGFGGDNGMFVAYPLIPWIGIMAVGYAFGTIYKLPVEQRKAQLFSTGITCIILFVILRVWNIYGNPTEWIHYPGWWRNILSVLNCQKYPPSLDYTLMTIGPSLIALALLENTKNAVSDFFTVYGRVPMFYYLLHVPLIHGLAVLISTVIHVPIGSLFQPNPAWGFGLGTVYVIWIAVVLALYFPSRAWMRLKQRRSDWWLSYL